MIHADIMTSVVMVLAVVMEKLRHPSHVLNLFIVAEKFVVMSHAYAAVV
jgi:hypothetical protein